MISEEHTRPGPAGKLAIALGVGLILLLGSLVLTFLAMFGVTGPLFNEDRVLPLLPRMMAVMVLFPIWSFCCHLKTRRAGHSPRFHPAAAFYFYLIPVAQIVLPVLFMFDIQNGLARPATPTWRRYAARALATGWWAAFVVVFAMTFAFLGHVTSEMALSEEHPGLYMGVIMGLCLFGSLCALLMIADTIHALITQTANTKSA